MWGVVADDLTGAAEIAAAAVVRGRRAEVHLNRPRPIDVDVLVVDTHSRSVAASPAAQKAGQAARDLRAAGCPWIYKKVDSVLRGPVLAELRAVQAALGATRVLLVPANPSLGRVVRSGRYCVNGHPLDETEFMDHPDAPARTSDVRLLLGGSEDVASFCLADANHLPERGVLIGDAEQAADLLAWARHADDQTLCAGARDFFVALLEARGDVSPASRAAPEAHARASDLFVCGSGSSASREFFAEMRASGATVRGVRPGLRRGVGSAEPPVRAWADEIVEAIRGRSRAVVGIDAPFDSADDCAQSCCDVLAELAFRVLEVCPDLPVHLRVEGGQTASTLVRRMGWSRLTACGVAVGGFPVLRPFAVERRWLTVKPGSYPWPRPIRDSGT